MPLYSRRTALGMLPVRSCGKPSISLGTSFTVFHGIQLSASCSNHVPWIIIGICFACNIALLLTIRFVLNRENKRRDNEPSDDTYDDVYIERVTADGQREMVKVDKVRKKHYATPSITNQRRLKEFLDLTDIQNRDFRYVL